jgi:uncharacterized protein YndB with AHSA1/START domain
MPELTLTAHAAAPVEEVWKLVHDPTRYPEWWQGIAAVRSGPDDVYTIWPDGYPDFPMDQRMTADATDGRITISCLVSDLVFTWELHPAGEETDIALRVEIPEHEAHREDTQRRLMTSSLATLARLATG